MAINWANMNTAAGHPVGLAGRRVLRSDMREAVGVGADRRPDLSSVGFDEAEVVVSVHPVDDLVLSRVLRGR